MEGVIVSLHGFNSTSARRLNYLQDAASSQQPVFAKALWGDEATRGDNASE